MVATEAESDSVPVTTNPCPRFFPTVSWGWLSPFLPSVPRQNLCLFSFSRDSRGRPPPGAGVIGSSRPSTPKGPQTRRSLSCAFCLLRGRVPAYLESLPNASRRDLLPPVCQQVAGALGTRFGLRGSGSPRLLRDDLWVVGSRGQCWVVALVPHVCSAPKAPGYGLAVNSLK